jgi:hypothetical protein
MKKGSKQMGAQRTYIRASLRGAGVEAKNLKDWTGSTRRMLKNPKISIKIIVTPKKKQKK